MEMKHTEKLSFWKKCVFFFLNLSRAALTRLAAGWGLGGSGADGAAHGYHIHEEMTPQTCRLTPACCPKIQLGQINFV